MKKYIFIILNFFLYNSIFSQNPGDTIIVQTFDYSMTYGQAWGPPRDTVAYFPSDTSLKFEKIIMSYSMRCKDAQVNTSGGNNIACGEWDYSCHTYIHDSTKIDSTLNKILSHISNTTSLIAGITYNFVNSPVYNYYYNIDSLGNLTIDSIISNADTITKHTIFSNPNTLSNDSIASSTSLFWSPVSNTYDTAGNILYTDTIPSNVSFTISELNYYKRYPMAFQIMSFVTPYGIGLDLGTTGKTWYFDLTDYSPIFRGPKRITVSGGGQWQEDMDIKFYFIVGTPPRDVLDAQQIWRPQSKSYTSIINNDCFEPRSFILPNGSSHKIKSVITGHGQQGEFIPRDHFISVDNNTTQWRVWTECSGNPIYPQGGTWIYDRAGWCPGQASDLKEIDISSFTNSGQQYVFDYGLTSANGSSNYWVSNQLITYGSANFNLDAKIYDIISPSDKVINSRKNPICSKPEIIIQNTGKDILNSLEIEYWVNNSNFPLKYVWSGNLSFLEKDTILLPDPDSLWDNINSTSSSKNIFHVNIQRPNGSNDEYIFNNKLNSSFIPAPEYSNIFTIWVQTNLGVINTLTQQSETSWEIVDNNNISVFNSGVLYSNTQYRDTVLFNPGCYTFRVTDVDDDGLDFWANNDGAGMIRFREIGATWFKIFDCDFGSFIEHEFRIPKTSMNTNEENPNNLVIYPNPSNEKINIKGSLNNITRIFIQDKLGRTIFSQNNDVSSLKRSIDLSSFSKGIYFLNFEHNTQNITKKLIIE